MEVFAHMRSPRIGVIFLCDNISFSRIVRVVEKLVRYKTKTTLIVFFWHHNLYVQNRAALTQRIGFFSLRIEIFELGRTSTLSTRWPVWAVYLNQWGLLLAPLPSAPMGEAHERSGPAGVRTPRKCSDPPPGANPGGCVPAPVTLVLVM